MTPGFAKSRQELFWLPYPEADRVIINAHNFTVPTWTPADITTALWADFSSPSTMYDASSGGSVITNDGYVGRHVEKSANAWSFIQATATSAARPQWKASQQNGLGAISLAHSTAAFLRSSTYNGESTKNKFVRVWVAKLNSQLTNQVLAWPDASFIHLQIYSNGLYTYIDSGSVSGGNATTLLGTGWHVISSVFDATQAAASRLKLFVDGTLVVAGQAGSGGGNTPATLGMNIGYSGLSWPGLIGEGVVVASSTTEQQRLEGYLAWRWGIQANLPVGHPYKSAAP